MSLPNCTNWRGHKFEARYSVSAPTYNVKTQSGIWPSDIIPLVEASKSKTYERDICIRCGAVVEKVKP